MNARLRLRNLGISAHIDAGKTTLTERMLFYCGRIHTVRDVRGGDGGATMDSDPIEKDRGITISSAATRIQWNEYVINVIDTPGHVDFTVEVERSLRVLDGAVLVLCAVGGVQSQSLTVDRQMRRYGVPRIAVINKMDRIGANPMRVIAELQERLGANPIALQLPLGTERDFDGVIDLVTMQAVRFRGQFGEVREVEAIPVELQAVAKDAREQMLESLAMLDDDLMDQMLRGENPSELTIRRVIRESTMTHRATPVLLASAYKNKGVQEVLDAAAMYLPSPAEREIAAIDQRTTSGNSQMVRLLADNDRPLVAMAFKTVVEKFGQLTYLRVYQGTLQRGCTYQNSRTGKKVRVGRLVRMHAAQQEDIECALAGDIVGVIGIDCASGDTFSEIGFDVALENIVVADPVMQRSIEPVRREDADKLSKALDKFRREDPTFRVSTDAKTGQTLIAGMGQLHLEVYVQRLREKFQCECIVGNPSVAYKERPSRVVEFDHKIKKMTGGPGTYARIVGRMVPLPIESDSTFEFKDEITGGRIDRKFIPAVKAGFAASLKAGPIGKHEVTGVHITLLDGDQHEKDSSELAFKNCAAETMRNEIFAKAEFVLLEPVMQLTIEIPQEFNGAVVGYLARKRGSISSSSQQGSICEIVAQAPLAEMFDFADDLRSLTQGNGSFVMQPLCYQQAPRT